MAEDPSTPSGPEGQRRAAALPAEHAHLHAHGDACGCGHDHHHGHHHGLVPRLPAQRADKVGRNEPCPCGSGRKYKRCCLAAAAPR